MPPSPPHPHSAPAFLPLSPIPSHVARHRGTIPVCVSRADFSVAVYVVTDRRIPASQTVPEIVSAALQGDGAGNAATMIQLRDKNVPRAETLQLGQTLRGLTRRHSAGLIVNDDISLAVAVGADGVHLGQDDAAVCEARSALGAGAIVGVSAGTAEEARRAVEDGADYIGVGCVFGTATKDDAGEAIGVDGLAEVVQAVQGRVPVVAIGGVDERNAGRCMRAGADGVAVVGAVMRGGRPGQAAAGLARIVREGREARGKAPGG